MNISHQIKNISILIKYLMLYSLLDLTIQPHHYIINNTRTQQPWTLHLSCCYLQKTTHLNSVKSNKCEQPIPRGRRLSPSLVSCFRVRKLGLCYRACHYLPGFHSDLKSQSINTETFLYLFSNHLTSP